MENEYETPEVELDTENPEEDEGSYLTTAAVFGVGAITGAVVARSYGKVKETVIARIAARRAGKTQEIEPASTETPAEVAE